MDSRLVLAEQLNVLGGNPYQHHAGLRDYPITGTLLITEQAPELLAQLQQLVAAKDAQVIAGITHIDGVMALRMLGHRMEPMMALAIQAWQCTREHWLGYTPLPPRIWAT